MIRAEEDKKDLWREVKGLRQDFQVTRNENSALKKNIATLQSGHADLVNAFTLRVAGYGIRFQEVDTHLTNLRNGLNNAIYDYRGGITRISKALKDTTQASSPT